VYRFDRLQLGRIILVAIPSLAGATVVVAILEAYVGVPNASAVYLVAVVITAFVTGTLGAIVAAVGSFLLYNFLFTQPLYTFTIADPGVLLGVVLLLLVGIVGVVHLFLRGGWIGPALIALALVAGFGGMAFPYLRAFAFRGGAGGAGASFGGKLTDPTTAVSETNDGLADPPPEPPQAGRRRLRDWRPRRSRNKGSAGG